MKYFGCNFVKRTYTPPSMVLVPTRFLHLIGELLILSIKWQRKYRIDIVIMTFIVNSVDKNVVSRFNITINCDFFFIFPELYECNCFASAERVPFLKIRLRYG